MGAGLTFVSISARPRVGNWSRYGNLYCDPPYSQAFGPRYCNDLVYVLDVSTVPVTILPKRPSSRDPRRKHVRPWYTHDTGTVGTHTERVDTFVRLTDRLTVRPVGTGSKKEIKARRCEFGAERPPSGYRFKVWVNGSEGKRERCFRDRGNNLRPSFLSPLGVLDPSSFPPAMEVWSPPSPKAVPLPAHTRNRGAH